ncbi:MAG TPA: ABC transporter permease [Microbacteriaceae bacterium]|nr:ABC transporter permease [Microbacteriaceae bacterium]
MIVFLARRLALGAIVLWAITTVVFVMFFVAPSHVAQLIAGRQSTPQTVALVSHRLGLDRPLLTQYGDYLWRLLHGDLGYSYYNSTPVTTLIGQRIGVTVSLALGAAALWILIGVSSGVLAAIRPRSFADRTVTAAALLFYSMPVFLLGLILLYFLFYRLTLSGVDLFPGSGYVPLGQDPVQWAQHLALPWLSLALVTAATYTRLTRGAMLDVLGEDYIRTARSKGMRERRVTYRHALRGALTPMVTQLGIDLGTVLGGAIITENVFGLPGLGALAVQSVIQQDQPVIIGTVILASAFIVVSSIVVDLVYALLDPRVRAH